MANQNAERDNAIYRERMHGASWPDLAARYKLTENRIMCIVAAVRNRAPAPTATDLKADLTDQLNELRYLAYQLASDSGVEPKDRVKAISAATGVIARLAKMHGMDSSVQIDTNGTVEYRIIGVNPEDV